MTSERIKCPSCGVALLLPVPLRGSRGTCPRCLAEVTALEVRREPGSIQAERPERREGVVSCPHCGRIVEAIWITCPWCEEPLRGRERGRNVAADLDVRRDTKRTSWLLVLLAVIGGLGVGWWGLQILGAVVGHGEFSGPDLVGVMLSFAVPLLFLAGLSTLIVFVRSRGKPGAIRFRRVAVGTLALAGVVTLGTLLVILAAFVLAQLGFLWVILRRRCSFRPCFVGP